MNLALKFRNIAIPLAIFPYFCKAPTPRPGTRSKFVVKWVQRCFIRLKRVIAIASRKLEGVFSALSLTRVGFADFAKNPFL